MHDNKKIDLTNILFDDLLSEEACNFLESSKIQRYNNDPGDRSARDMINSKNRLGFPFKRTPYWLGLFLILYCIPFLCRGQTYIEISGTVRDENNERLPGAHVMLINGLENFTVVTDNAGKFELSKIPLAPYQIHVTFLGYKPHTGQIVLDSTGTTIEITLKEANINLDQAIVTADRLSNISKAGNLTLTRKEVDLTHGGIEDPVASLSILPGATRFGGRFSSSPLSVRGGSGYETVYLMDNAMVVSPYQFSRSLFNTDVIEDIEFLSGGYPASYGQALSAVSNFSLRNGNFEKWGNDLFSYDIYHAKSLLDGPLVKDKLSLLTSLRSTFFKPLFRSFWSRLFGFSHC